jgi:hypothetical protein
MESRRESEYEGAIAIRSEKPLNRSSLLLAGNSLMLEGVDFPRLASNALPEFQAHRFVVENTSYFDWYFGLRRIFKQGARPDVVALMLNPIQLTSSKFDGDYAAHLLVDRGDLLEFGHQVSADRNDMTSLALANVSSFYGTRSEVRTWLLGKIMPGVISLFRQTTASPKYEISRDLSIQRMLELSRLCSQYGAQFVIVLPPSRQGIGFDVVLEGAKLSGVKILMPVAPGVLPATDFSDGFHLNAGGAAKFTPYLAAELKQLRQNCDGVSAQTELARLQSLPKGAAGDPRGEDLINQNCKKLETLQ